MAGHIYSLMGDYSHCERILVPLLGIFRTAFLGDDVIVEEEVADIYVQALSGTNRSPKWFHIFSAILLGFSEDTARVAIKKSWRRYQGGAKPN
jgi:hypothetical protein